MGSKRALRKSAYDHWLADKISGGEFANIQTVTEHSNMSPAFAYVETYSSFVKYFQVVGFPTYIDPTILDKLRKRVLRPGVRMNYYQLGEAHTIDWSSPEMKNKVAAWRRYTADVAAGVEVWNFRESKKEHDQKLKLIDSTLYLNEAELVQQRTTCKVQIYIQIIIDKNLTAVANGNAAVKDMIKLAKINDLKIKPIKMNMIDWLRYLQQFSRVRAKELKGKVAANIMTDDVVANLAGYKQGRIGDKGIPVGMDVIRKEAVLYEFKSDPNKVENWLISAFTGGGKSYFIKNLLPWLLAIGYTETILDYEGDEYIELYEIMKRCDPKSAVLVSMGKGSAMHIEPMEIPDLVGDPDIDDDLKDTAQEYTIAMFRIIVHGTAGDLTRWEEGIVSRAIANVYDEHRVTNDKKTWCRSKGITIREVYDDIKRMVEQKELFDEMSDNIQHKAALEIVEAGRSYFEEDGAKSAAFRHPLSITDLRDAQLIIFSFGIKGAVASSTDKSILALKQLSVANISTQISNYCKYVKHTFNVKLWEEFQRYVEVEGTAEIISNTLTGGRKRGDINFIITNDLNSILDDSKTVMKQIRQSISTYCIGKIKDPDTAIDFCTKFKCKEVQDELLQLAKTDTSDAQSIYNHTFCVMFDDGKKALVRAELPRQLSDSALFSTGVKKKQE